MSNLPAKIQANIDIANLLISPVGNPDNDKIAMDHLDSIIKQIKECYHKVYGNDIVEIFLYGSYARGDFSIDSEIDIAAIVRGERLELQEKLKKIWDISAQIGLDNDIIVSPTVIPYDEFNKYKQSVSYYRNILEEGKKVG